MTGSTSIPASTDEVDSTVMLHRSLAREDLGAIDPSSSLQQVGPPSDGGNPQAAAATAAAEPDEVFPWDSASQATTMELREGAGGREEPMQEVKLEQAEVVEPMVEPAAAQAAQAKAQESGRGQSEAMGGVLDGGHKSESSELELKGANFVHTGMHLIDAVQRNEVRQHAEATLRMPHHQGKSQEVHRVLGDTGTDTTEHVCHHPNIYTLSNHCANCHPFVR